MRALDRTRAGRMVAMTAAVAMSMLAGCGNPPRSSLPAPTDTVAPLPSVSAPTDPRADYRDPTAVCLRFAAAVYRRDTRTDRSAQDAYRRATAYATAELAAAVAALPAGRDPQWSTWQAHHAATDPTATTAGSDDPPAAGDGAAHRAASVMLTPVGADGWRGPTETHVVYCQLRHDQSGWRIDHYDLGGTP